MISGKSRYIAAIVSGLFIFSAGLETAARDLKQFTVFNEVYSLEDVAASDAKISLEKSGLRIRTGHTKEYPGITLKAPAGKWDLSKYQWISLDVQNHGTEPVKVFLRVDNPGSDGKENSVTQNVKVAPGKIMPLTVTVGGLVYINKKTEIIGMRGDPFARRKIDSANINRMIVFVAHPQQDHDFSISSITAGGNIKKVDSEKFFPFIDQFGQFMHRDWPGKCYSVADIKTKGVAELEYLKQNPGPKDRNKYGGWLKGPKLKATGFFRVEKYKDKWWLVDPEGRLFFSHGINCIGTNVATPISDREHYFKDLPRKNSHLGAFYGKGSWAPHGYYKDHRPYRHYDFCKANLLRKYGDNWRAKDAELTHRRLRSWGINTIANWSDSNIYKMKRTAYVTTINVISKILEGSKGYWRKFSDVFDEDFRLKARQNIERKKQQDPWCIGYFFDNELSWGSDTSLAEAALKSPAKQKAKKVFIKDLRKKYQTIEKLNTAWDKKYKSWKHLLESTDDPDIKTEQGKEDLKAFYTKTAETYFRIIKEEMNKVVPDHLYLGCRFAWVNDSAARAASKYCDIVSYNRYTYSIEDLKLPDGSEDKPLINGEFHFGALDRGMFHTGLRKAKDQIERSEHYKNYVHSALANPAVVGTHWFQYRDQATTGRGDGENYQIGFLDVCDKPYYEIIRVAAEIGKKMYEYRYESKNR